MHTELLKEYAALEAEYKALEGARELLRQRIVEEFKSHEMERVESEYGNFTLGRRQVWIYTEAVKKIEERLKIAREKEQRKGLATASSTEYLVYKPHQD